MNITESDLRKIIKKNIKESADKTGKKVSLGSAISNAYKYFG
jgi:hypothetical protein